MKFLTLISICLCAFISFGQENGFVSVKRTLKLMGSEFDITVVTLNEEIGYINIEEIAAEIRRIEKLISSVDEDSETFLINKNAGIKPVKVSSDLFKLIARSKQISEITSGAFDITYAPLHELWKFDGSMSYLPSEADIKKAINKIGYNKIILDEKESTVFLLEKGMKISFDAIGKGYAIDKAKELIVSKEVRAGVINSSGTLTTWGTKATGEKWLLGVANPMNTANIFSWLPIVESSSATAGNREEFISFKDKKYTNILDPRTGYPANGIRSVSVFGKNAEFCDALSTAIYVLGKDLGLSLINQLAGTEVVLIDNDNKVYRSFGILFENTP